MRRSLCQLSGFLALLGSDESLPLTELARRAGLRKSQLSRGAAALLEKDLLYRAVSREDAREARRLLKTLDLLIEGAQELDGRN